jgi:hypothetical protein
MRKSFRAALLFCCGLFAVALLPVHSQSPRLNLYVQPLQAADADLAKSVREKLIVELEKRGIAVVESGEGADAVLSGSGLVESPYPTSLGHRPSIRIRAGMRLVNRKGVAIWAGDVSSARFAVSRTASFVDKAADGVQGALAQESKRRASEPATQK